MKDKKPINYDPTKLIEAINKWPNPMFDKKHNLYIYVNECAINDNNNLKIKDINRIPKSMTNYFLVKRDIHYQNTLNYYFKRDDKENGLIKMSVAIDNSNHNIGYIKTIFITHQIKELDY